MPMQKPSRLLPDDSHHLMATDCVLPQVALWGKGMVCALKRTSGLNGWISNQKHISLQSVALREGSRGFEAFKDIQVFQSQHIRIIKIFSKLNSDIFDEISPPSFPRSIPHKHIFELFSR